MIEGLKPYADYKESGLNWLGQIPNSWETPRTKTRFRLSIEKSGVNHGKELLSVYTHIGVRPRKDLEERGNKASSTNDYWVVRQGDIIVNKLLAWMGAVGVSHFDGVTSPAYDILRPVQKLEPDYYHLLFRTKLYLQLFKSRSRGIMDMRLRLYFDQLGQIPLICPPRDDQAAIVRFLDHANRKIDGFIRAKRKLIGLLNEQKQAIIHRAVTRGLDPDVPLKPSGVPWLGDIPLHWDVRQVRRATTFVTSGSRGWANFYSDDGLVFIQSGNLGRNMALNFSYTQHVRPPFGAEGERTRVHRDDILICITGALTGNVVHVDQELPGQSFVNQHVALVRVRKTNVRPRFLAFALRSEVGQGQFKTSEYGGTKQGLGLGDVKDVYFPLPSLTEQDAIIEHIDSSLAVFNTAIARTEREIALMQEYRTRLTADIVTGKLDVREAAAKLPDLPTEPTGEALTDEALDDSETEDAEA